LACDGLLVRSPLADGGCEEETWLHFVDDRPVSDVIIECLAGCCARLKAVGKEALLVWDNAFWHVIRAMRTWIRTQNRRVTRSGRGVRIIT
jgi:hypothetical protein